MPNPNYFRRIRQGDDGASPAPDTYIVAAGGIVTRDGDYLVHTFTGSDTLNITQTSNNNTYNSLEYLIVAGGGGGGCLISGGGGAGGLATSSFVPAVSSYPIVVGSGGTGATSRYARGTNGSTSSALGISMSGGGAGGSDNGGVANSGITYGASGGSGGGGSYPQLSPGGAGINNFAGGNGNEVTISTGGGAGGGGGAGQIGQTATRPNGGNGGNGVQTSISGTARYYAGGGGGGASIANGGGTIAGIGGLGGGGNATLNDSPGVAGTTNTGGGGGGGGYTTVGGSGGNGGSGIVIVRYFSPTVPTPYLVATGGDVTRDGDYLIHTFRGSDNFTVLSLSSNAAFNLLKVNVVAGGGGGGNFSGGGGGAGGFIENLSYSLSNGANSYLCSIGSGGNKSTSQSAGNTNGSNSTFDTLTAIGGGKGGVQGVSASSGGSGGGQNGQLSTPSAAGTAGQGFAGGVGTGTTQAGGGGGGASAIGANGVSPGIGGAGGAGRLSSITGNYYAGGGGGAGQSGSAALGGIGGGGNGELSSVNPAATNGQANTGGGGGAMYLYNAANGGNGGSGIIVISYYSPQDQYIVATGGTVTRDGNYLIHTFTGTSGLNITNAPSNAVLEYLIVAGGGGGGADLLSGGGGGAGGFLTGGLIPGLTNYSIVVGAGGAATGGAGSGANGLNSSAFSLTSIGGGGGAQGFMSTTPAGSGGSGGGAGALNGGSGLNGFNGTGTVGQGFNGGLAFGGPGYAASGAGGGAGAVGNNANSTQGGNGGIGKFSIISGGANYYAGGGGGGSYANVAGIGSVGGGGDGSASTAGGNGVANFGAGGGGGKSTSSGGSGIVVVRYLSPLAMGPYTLAFYNEVISRGGSLTVNETNSLTAFETSMGSELAEFDRLFIHGLSSNVAARTSFVNPSTTAITAVNSPTFLQNVGYQGNGATAYLDTNYNPLTQGVKYTLNNASGFAYIGTNVIGGAAFGTYDNVNAPAFLYPQFAANQPVYYINSIATGSNGTGNSLGLSTVNRTGSAALNLYKNGVLNASSTVASSVIPSLSMFILGYNNNGGGAGALFAGVVSLTGFGSSNYNQATLYNSVISLGTSLGWFSYTTNFKAVVLSRGGSLTTSEESYLRAFEASVGSDLAEFDRLYIHGLSNSIAARTSFVNPSSTIITEVNAPTFTANRGYQGNGATSYLNTNFTPSTQGVKYTQNSASLFIYSRTNVAANYIDIGVTANLNKSFIIPRDTGSFSFYPTNLSTSIGSPSAGVVDSLGLYQTRLLSGVLNFYQRGVAIGSFAMTPVALATDPFYLLAGNNANTPVLLSARQISVSGMGSGAINQTTFNNAIRVLGTSIGWAV
jgi:hypothetical protein